MQKDHIYHTKQYQTFYRKIKCDLFNFRGVKSGYHRDLQYLLVSIRSFEMETLMQSFMTNKLQSQKKKKNPFFLMERLYYTFK